jgi:hypothetical protein
VYTGSATVNDAPLAGAPIEGATALQGVSTPVPLAHFADADPGGMTSDYTATIDWGDKTPQDTSGKIVPSGSGWDVVGTHTYATAGTYVATVGALDTLFDFTTQKVNVQVSSSGAVALSAAEGTGLSNALVAQFCAVPSAPTSASISWSDGAGTGGTVVKAGSCYQVDGSHTYSEESTTPLPTHVVLNYSGGSLTADGTRRSR